MRCICLDFQRWSLNISQHVHLGKTKLYIQHRASPTVNHRLVSQKKTARCKRGANKNSYTNLIKATRVRPSQRLQVRFDREVTAPLGGAKFTRVAASQNLHKTKQNDGRIEACKYGVLSYPAKKQTSAMAAKKVPDTPGFLQIFNTLVAREQTYSTSPTAALIKRHQCTTGKYPPME